MACSSPESDATPPGLSSVASTSTGVPSPTSSTATVDTTTASTTSTPKTTTTAGSAVSSTVTTTTTAAAGSHPEDERQLVPLRIESRVTDVTTADFAEAALAILNDPRGWVRAGFTFVRDDVDGYLLVLAEGPEVDELCLPLDTATKVSCQNGPVVALNADRWRVGVSHWDADIDSYRGYLVNHEVGHLLGQRHPTPRCPVADRPAAVMEPQTGNLKGCRGNAWPREWEIAHASQRPVVYAPLPDWAPEPIPPNLEA